MPPLLVKRGYEDSVIAETVLRIKARTSGVAATKFKATYRDAPSAFVHDCITWKRDEGPTPYQDEILTTLPEKKRVSVRGPHGLGKTTIDAWFVLWFALTRDGEDWKCPTTASAWRQLTKFLWPEIHKWARRLRWERIGREPFDPRTELLTRSLKLRTGEAFAVASNNAALIEGAHADCLMYIFDESKTIPGDTFDAAEGAFSGGSDGAASEAYAVAMSTPGEPVGRFYEIQSRKPGYEDWWARAVTLAETVQARRVSQQWADQRKKQWGENSAVYQNRVKGEFASSEEDGVIPLSWVEQAMERWREWEDAGKLLGSFECVGADIARSGEDKTVLAPRFGDIITELRRYSQEDTMATVGRIKGILDLHKGRAIVDVIGLGAGVVDRLREQGYDVVAFNAAEHSDAKDRSGELGFINKRSAGWWALREMLEPGRGNDIALPPDDTLIGDLTSAHWRVQSGGKIQVESKDDIKKRIGRSTDDGDAVMMAFAGEGTGTSLGWYDEETLRKMGYLE